MSEDWSDNVIPFFFLIFWCAFYALIQIVQVLILGYFTPLIKEKNNYKQHILFGVNCMHGYRAPHYHCSGQSDNVLDGIAYCPISTCNFRGLDFKLQTSERKM